MPQNNLSKIRQIFSASDVKHGLSLFTDREIRFMEGLIRERDGKFHIKCQIKDKYKVTKPEEIVRQLWVYRLLNESFGLFNFQVSKKEDIYLNKEIRNHG